MEFRVVHGTGGADLASARFASWFEWRVTRAVLRMLDAVDAL